MKFYARFPVSALLVGMVILCATLPARANLLTDPSFEDNSIGTIIGGGAPFFFTRTWEIDLGKIVGTENGIVPLDGDQMLLFDTPPPSLSTDIYQLVNVSGFAAAIAAQTATLVSRLAEVESPIPFLLP